MSSENPKKLCPWWVQISSFQGWSCHADQWDEHSLGLAFLYQTKVRTAGRWACGSFIPRSTWCSHWRKPQHWLVTTCFFKNQKTLNKWHNTAECCWGQSGWAWSTYCFHHCQGGDKCNLQDKTEILVMGRKRPDWWPSVPSPMPDFGSMYYLLFAGSVVCRAHPVNLACSSTWWLWPTPRDSGPCESDDLPCSSAPVWTSHMLLFWSCGC